MIFYSSAPLDTSESSRAVHLSASLLRTKKTTAHGHTFFRWSCPGQAVKRLFQRSPSVPYPSFMPPSLLCPHCIRIHLFYPGKKVTDSHYCGAVTENDCIELKRFPFSLCSCTNHCFSHHAGLIHAPESACTAAYTFISRSASIHRSNPGTVPQTLRPGRCA